MQHIDTWKRNTHSHCVCVGVQVCVIDTYNERNQYQQNMFTHCEGSFSVQQLHHSRLLINHHMATNIHNLCVCVWVCDCVPALHMCVCVRVRVCSCVHVCAWCMCVSVCVLHFLAHSPSCLYTLCTHWLMCWSLGQCPLGCGARAAAARQGWWNTGEAGPSPHYLDRMWVSSDHHTRTRVWFSLDRRHSLHSMEWYVIKTWHTCQCVAVIPMISQWCLPFALILYIISFFYFEKQVYEIG